MTLLRYGFFILFAIGTQFALAEDSKTSFQKKECAVYSGESDVEWRTITIKPGDIIDLELIPETDRLAFYSELYMQFVKNDEVSFVDCTESK